jgi:hypothetical protein
MAVTIELKNIAEKLLIWLWIFSYHSPPLKMPPSGNEKWPHKSYFLQ